MCVRERERERERARTLCDMHLLLDSPIVSFVLGILFRPIYPYIPYMPYSQPELDWILSNIIRCGLCGVISGKIFFFQVVLCEPVHVCVYM